MSIADISNSSSLGLVNPIEALYLTLSPTFNPIISAKVRLNVAALATVVDTIPVLTTLRLVSLTTLAILPEDVDVTI